MKLAFKMIILILLAGLSISSFALPLDGGSYKGVMQKMGSNGEVLEYDVDFLVRPLDGREGSYVAVIGIDRNRGQYGMVLAYLLDDIGSGRYSLTTFTVDESGDLGLSEDNPTLVLIDHRTNYSKDLFTIVPSNQDIAQGNIIIKKKTKRISWREYMPGQFSGPSRSESGVLNLTPFDINEGIGNASIASVTSLNGDFTLSGNYPYLYSVHSNNTTRSGTMVERLTRKIAVFIHRKSVFAPRGRVELVLINPENMTDVNVFRSDFRVR